MQVISNLKTATVYNAYAKKTNGLVITGTLKLNRGDDVVTNLTVSEMETVKKSLLFKQHLKQGLVAIQDS